MSTSKYTDKVREMQKVLEELVVEANAICQFSQRNTELNGERFVQVLVLGWLKKGDASLNELAEMATDLGCAITGSALHERISTAAVRLLGYVLMAALHQRFQVAPSIVDALADFTAVHVTDSTQISLPQSLREDFAGGNDDAKLKLQVTLEYVSGQLVALEMEPGQATDRASELPVKQAIAGSLNIFDLGYFKQERLRDITQQAAFFVSRYQAQTAVYEIETGERFDLAAYLRAHAGRPVDCWLRLGARVQVPVRLVARPAPQAIADKRRRQAKKTAREQGYTCSATYLYLLGWDILLTNLADEQWPLTQIFDLYPIRMQIEWVFRVWKSQLRVDYFGKWRVERVLCQLYAHLIGIVLCHRLTYGWVWQYGQEHSFAKCVQVIQRKITDLMCCIHRHWYGIQAWVRRLEEAFQHFGRKTKRKKEPSTLQTLMDWGLS
jgi:hypothetical protein